MKVGCVVPDGRDGDWVPASPAAEDGLAGLLILLCLCPNLFFRGKSPTHSLPAIPLSLITVRVYGITRFANCVHFATWIPSCVAELRHFALASFPQETTNQGGNDSETCWRNCGKTLVPFSAHRIRATSLLIQIVKEQGNRNITYL